MRTLSLLRCLENEQSLIDYPQDYTVHGLLWDYCIFSECNVLIAIYSLVIVVITVV